MSYLFTRANSSKMLFFHKFVGKFQILSSICKQLVRLYIISRNSHRYTSNLEELNESQTIDHVLKSHFLNHRSMFRCFWNIYSLFKAKGDSMANIHMYCINNKTKEMLFAIC